jgi:DNA ligase-1
MLFDIPKHEGFFKERILEMEKLVQESGSKYLSVIRQMKIRDEKHLMILLKEIEKKGGEGLMIHREDSLYSTVRNDDLLKLKSFFDAEAKVLKHFSGKGKYQEMMGSILVENEEGVRFKIGGGFSDQERKKPPIIGSVITYKYYGKTKNNKPRFASFLRIRENYDFKLLQKTL